MNPSIFSSLPASLPLVILPLLLAGCGGKTTDDTGTGGSTTDGGTTGASTTDGGTETGTDGGTETGTDGGTETGTDGGTTTTTADIEIAGSWIDGWGTSHTITNTLWDQGYSLFHISQYDNELKIAIAQNDKANKWSSSLWSQFDWTWDSRGTLWYCQVAYDAATESDALAASPADPTDPANGGCSSFAWTPMTPAR